MATRTFSWSSRTLMMIVVAAFTCADQPITRHTGTNVTLEFQVPNGIASWWLKRLGRDEYIFHCRDGHSIRSKDQEESFKGRVEGMDCDKINGTVSVTLSNLTESDSGPYEFYGVGSDGRLFNETRSLNVTDSGPSGGTTEDGGKEDEGTNEGIREHYGLFALLLAPLVVIVVVASKVCRACKKKDLKHLLNSALCVARTNDQEVMERAASDTFLGRPQTV